MGKYSLFEIAVSVLSFFAVAPLLALAILPFGLLGAPVFIALLLPVALIAASAGR